MLSVNCKDCLLFTIGIKDTFAVHQKDILLESAILHQGPCSYFDSGHSKFMFDNSIRELMRNREFNWLGLNFTLEHLVSVGQPNHIN